MRGFRLGITVPTRARVLKEPAQKLGPARCIQADLPARLTKVNIVKLACHFHSIEPIEEWSVNQRL